MYDLNCISSYLKTNIIGQSIIQYDDLNSTTSKAKNIFATCPDGTVILSEEQSKCTLRFGEEWVCFPDKNIYLSIILKSVDNKCPESLMDTIGFSSIYKSISELYNLDCKIKWPNDILINDKRLASVKSEAVSRGSGIILSLNINVNINEEIENDSFTSVNIEKGEDVERELLIANILNNVEYHYNKLTNYKNAVDAIELYNKNLLFNNKEIKIVRYGRKTVRKVIAKNINDEGNLIVVNEKGYEEVLSSGDTIIQYEEKET